MAKRKASKLTDPNDPWNQNFTAFRTYYLSQTGQIPKVTTFESTALNTLLRIPGAARVAFYPMRHPDNDKNGVMVAIAFDTAGNRLSTATLKYAVALHNCPPECDKVYDNLPQANVKPRLKSS